MATNQDSQIVSKFIIKAFPEPYSHIFVNPLMFEFLIGWKDNKWVGLRAYNTLCIIPLGGESREN